MEKETIPAPIKEYRQQRDAFKKWLAEHYRDTGKRRKKKNKTPWYYMTKGKCFNYETRKESWGDNTNYYRVPSMSKLFNEKHKRIFQKESFIQQLIDAKLRDWDKTHPRPVAKDSQQPDLFESQFIPQWVSDRGKERDRIESLVRTKYDKVQVFARFELKKGEFTNGASGYPIYCGAIKDYHGEYRRLYNTLTATSKDHLFKRTKVVSMAQKIANNLQKLYPAKDKDGNRLYPRFIGIQIYFGDGTCPKILLPE